MSKVKCQTRTKEHSKT